MSEYERTTGADGQTYINLPPTQEAIDLIMAEQSARADARESVQLLRYAIRYITRPVTVNSEGDPISFGELEYSDPEAGLDYFATESEVIDAIPGYIRDASVLGMEHGLGDIEDFGVSRDGSILTQFVGIDIRIVD